MNGWNLLDTPRFHTAIAEWAACLAYVLLLQKRYPTKRTVLQVAASLPVFFLYHYIAGEMPLWTWIPTMMGAVLLMYLMLLANCRTSLMDNAFFCIYAFLLAELAASIEWQACVWCMWILFKGPNLIASMIIMAVSYLLIFPAYYFFTKGHIPHDAALDVSRKELFSALLIAAATFSISNISFAMENTPFSVTATSILYVRTLVDLGGLVILLVLQNRREEMRIQIENNAMSNLLQKQYNQYRLAVDSADLLRRELHDLKHYLSVIRAEENPERKEQYFSEMEQAIMTQEALIDTGNHVLDVVLTTKSLYCSRHDITFNCMADGKLLNFIHVKDICSIFGNALDNAIESVMQMEDEQKHLIILNVKRKKQFLLIECENFTDNQIPSSGAFPPTSKADNKNHGYGLKSIRAAAEKYGGTVSISSENQWFTLQILIPLPPEN